MSKGKILVTGKNIEPDYNRNLIILNGLKKLGYAVQVFNFEKKNKETAEKIRRFSEDAFFVLLPSFSHKSVGFVKKHSAADVVFDPLISKYMTNVRDYKKYPAFSYGALRTSFRDKSSISKADFVIFDTEEHRKYFLNRYGISKEKTGVVYVGANSEDFHRQPLKKSNQEFIVGFIGHFIPLHGVFNILKSALLLQDRSNFKFQLIGTGFHFEKAKQFCSDHDITNVEFLGQVKYQELNKYINSFDLCLGIFSDNIKAYHVIPNKIFNYASCGKPVLSMRSSAIKEVFEHNKDIFLCNPDPNNIADSIKELYENPELRNTIGENIYGKVNSSYNEDKIAQTLLDQYIKFKKV